jgi:hypothetical protein
MFMCKIAQGARFWRTGAGSAALITVFPRFAG